MRVGERREGEEWGRGERVRSEGGERVKRERREKGRG